MSRPEPSVGVDLTEVQRWRPMRGAMRRLFSPREHRWCGSRRGAAARYAQLWAAKEAVYKCLSPEKPVDLRRIEIRFSAGGSPYAVVPRLGRVSGLRLSLARAGRLALAVALRR